MLSAENVTQNSRDIDKIRALYESAFPKEEKMPFWFLLRRAKKSFVNFLAFYDGDIFAGLVYVIVKDDLVFVLYFAVNSKIRSKGYGSHILQHLDEMYTEKRIVLEIEVLDESAENNDQREKRRAFYFKNGFKPAGFEITEGKVTYEVLVKNGECTTSELSDMYKIFGGVLTNIFANYQFRYVASHE